MSPVSRRTGKRYAAGSQATLDGYKDVATCVVCGQRIVASRQSFQFETDAVSGERRGWHRECGRPPC
jgi:hypothetical protein